MPVLEIPTTITLDTLNERDDDLIEVVELPSLLLQESHIYLFIKSAFLVFTYSGTTKR